MRYPKKGKAIRKRQYRFEPLENRLMLSSVPWTEDLQEETAWPFVGPQEEVTAESITPDSILAGSGLDIPYNILVSFYPQVHSEPLEMAAFDEDPSAFNVRISSSSDDAEEKLSDGSMYLDSSDIELGNDPGHNGDQVVGLRFQNMDIPPGATITAAYLEFTVDEVKTGSTVISIAAEATDNAPTFLDLDHNITGRETTAANVEWDIPAWDTVNETHASPDLSALIQEVVDRPGWSVNNSVAFIISGSGERTAGSYEGSVPAARLYIEHDGELTNDPNASPNGLPWRHSFPEATAAVYLDFDGGRWSGTDFGPYDLDDDPDTFNSAEAEDIIQCWEEVAAYFAMFDFDVTTEEPEFNNTPTSWTLISNDKDGGSANVGMFPVNQPRGANASSNARTRTSGITHEQGHVLGLLHQGEWDLNTDRVRSYRTSQDDVGPIMGVDYAGTFSRWWVGHTNYSPSVIQDDTAIILNEITINAPSGYTLGGYRPDDYEGDLHRPTFRATHLEPTGSTWETEGIIERLDDADTFSFDWTGGHVKVEAQGRGHSVSSPRYHNVISSVGVDLYVFDASGTLVGYNDVSSQDDYVFNVTMNLPEGRYYVVVSGHGDYADFGIYDLAITSANPSGKAAPVPGTWDVARLVSIDPSTDYWNNIVLNLENDDPTSTSVKVFRSTDGVSWSQVYSQVRYVATRTFMDTNITQGETYFYRYEILGGSGGDRASNNIIVRSSPKAVFDLTSTPWKTTSVILNWRDVGGDTGYLVEQSSDGTNYTEVGTTPTNHNSLTVDKLAPSTTYYFRVTTLAGENASPLASTVITTTTPATSDLNRIPEAIDDTAAKNGDSPVTISVLSNDSDPDTSDSLSIKFYTQPTSGTIKKNSNNTFTYTPQPGYTGGDSFTYTIKDSYKDSLDPDEITGRHTGYDIANVYVTDTQFPVITDVIVNMDETFTVSSLSTKGVGITSIEVAFSESVNFSEMPGEAVEVLSSTSGLAIEPDWIAGTGTSVLTLGFTDVPVTGDWLQVTLDSTMITDHVGFMLDGEPDPSGSGRNYLFDSLTDMPTGNGIEGGNTTFYVGTFIGDVNDDGTVDGSDMNILLSSMGSSSDRLNLDGIGVVDGADVAVLAGNYGASSFSPFPAEASAVLAIGPARVSATQESPASAGTVIAEVDAEVQDHFTQREASESHRQRVRHAFFARSMWEEEFGFRRRDHGTTGTDRFFGDETNLF